MIVPVAAAARGCRVIMLAQRSNAFEGATVAGFFGRSRLEKAPIRVGSTVTAPTATLATTIAEPMPIRPTNGMPVESRPARATTTIAPAASTDVPAVELATRALCSTESPAASCSR